MPASTKPSATRRLSQQQATALEVASRGCIDRTPLLQDALLVGDRDGAAAAVRLVELLHLSAVGQSPARPGARRENASSAGRGARQESKDRRDDKEAPAFRIPSISRQARNTVHMETLV